jgi:Transglycosylase SLT domain
MCQQQAPPPRVPFIFKVAVVVVALMVANGGMERLPAQAAGMFAGVLSGAAFPKLPELPGGGGGGGAGVRPSREAVGGIPANYRTLYRQAGAHYRMSWTILAGVGKVESGHGANNGPSSAGARGPMQFMPGTWRAYGRGNINDPRDAIPAAARLLVANGVRSNVDRALHLYNSGRPYCSCSAGYVAKVKSWARRYGGNF